MSSRLKEVFEANLTADRHAPLDTVAAEAREALQELILAELRAAGNAAQPSHFLARLIGIAETHSMPAGADVPAGFEGVFRDSGSSGGWFGIFVRAIGTELKRPNSSFRPLWQAAQLAGIEAMLSGLTRQIGEAGSRFPKSAMKLPFC